MFRAAVVGFLEFLRALLSRLFVTPLTWIVPRDPKAFAIFGRVDGRFIDNGKYFATWLATNAPPDVRAWFITSSREVVTDLAGKSRLVPVRYPSWKAFKVLLRSGTFVYDAAAMTGQGKVGFFTGARRVQLWHGTPLKEIEIVQHQRRDKGRPFIVRGLLWLHRKLIARFLHHHVAICTSDYLAREIFSRCFHADRIVATGYPRNDVILGGADYDPRLLDHGVDLAARAAIEAHRQRGGKTLLYAPTFRDDGTHPTDDGALDLDALSAFAREHDLLVALKLHPFLAKRLATVSQPNIIQIAPVSDVYPLLGLFDVLLTDYSSIYFDYLLLDRPVVFYPYDIERYIRGRNLMFDYDAMTPGPRATDFATLLTLLATTLAGQDAHRAERARVNALVNDHRDGLAMQRLWRLLDTVSPGFGSKP